MQANSRREPDSDHGKLPETPETEPGGEQRDDTSTEQSPEEELPSGEEALESAALRSEIAELKDRLLRAFAEAENVRFRAEREKVDTRKFAITNFARDLIGVADNFQRALSSIDGTTRDAGGDVVKNLISGIELTERELMAAFAKNGIRVILPAPGDKFDPNFHQAVVEVPASSQLPGHIVAVTQTGYALDDRLLRPAMVMVAGGRAADSGTLGPERDPGQG